MKARHIHSVCVCTIDVSVCVFKLGLILQSLKHDGVGGYLKNEDLDRQVEGLTWNRSAGNLQEAARRAKAAWSWRGCMDLEDPKKAVTPANLTPAAAPFGFIYNLYPA